MKVLSNRCIEISRPNPSFKDGQEAVIIKVGFNDVPDWVENDDYFKLNVMDGAITAFDSSAKSEEVQKERETLESLKSQVAEMEEKLENLKTKGDDKAASIRAEIADLEAERDALNEELEAKKKGNRR